MRKIWFLLLLVPLLNPAALAQNTTKKALKSLDKISNIDDKGNGKGGKSLSPGLQGRTNAELKKATNPGQGAGKSNSLGGALLDELIDDDDKKGGKGGKNKGKKK